jgi:hypothetical protein
MVVGPEVRLRSIASTKEAALRALALPAVVIAALAASVPLAWSATMHPELGAKLSGMGEHGVVNIQVKAKAGKLCWTFDLPTTKATASSIHVGSKGDVLVKLGNTYTRKGCVKAPAMTIEHLSTTPGKYWVWVDTKGHPGDLRGKLFAGMAHM